MYSHRLAFLVLILATLAIAAPATPAQAGGDDEVARSIELRIRVLVSEAEAMKKKGRHDAADLLMERAHAWKRELEQHRRARQPIALEKAETILHGLEMGLEALEALDRKAEFEAVRNVANGLRERMKQARRARAAEREQNAAQAKRHAKGPTTEREIVKLRLEILRHALHAFREANRRDLIEPMERAVHAYEVALTGRRDDEAKEIWHQAPKKEHLAELCGHAARLWAEWGHESKAHALKKLSLELRGREAPGAEDLEHLRRKVQELMEQAERLRHALEELSRKAR